MRWVVPAELEAAVLRATRAALGDAVLATGALTRAIVDRSQRYTSERDRLARPADPRGDLAARAAFFTIADALKVAVPVRELAGRGALPAARPLRVVDLGAGCGAMTLGLVATLDVPLAVTAIDHDAAALGIAAQAIRELAASEGVAVELATRTDDVTRAALPACDLVVLGSVLNELAPEAAYGVVARALAAVGDDGAVIAIEPALRETSRALHALRDLVIERGAGSIFAPCTRRGLPCPSLANPEDWCHEDRALELPPRARELARLTHLRDSGMKFSYLVLRKQPRDLVDAGEAAWRIVSAPLAAKGKLELFGCSAHGRVRLRLLKRHRAAGNRDFERADRGDVLVISEPPGEERLEITDATTVTRIDPSGGGDD